VEAILRS